MKLEKWGKITMGELEELTTEIAGGKTIQYLVGNHQLETTYNKKLEMFRTVNKTTGEIITSEQVESWFSNLLEVLVRHLLMMAED